LAACIQLYSLSCCALSRCPLPHLQVRVHERTHTGAKPYKCAFCDFRSAQGGNVRIHERRHTGDKRYPCPYCPFASVTSSATTSHVRRAHGGESHRDSPLVEGDGHLQVEAVVPAASTMMMNRWERSRRRVAPVVVLQAQAGATGTVGGAP
jgi:hypothetical protein